MEKYLFLEFGGIKVYHPREFCDDEFIVVDEKILAAAKCRINVLIAKHLGVNKIPYDVEITLEDGHIGNYSLLTKAHFPFKQLKAFFMYIAKKAA